MGDKLHQRVRVSIIPGPPTAGVPQSATLIHIVVLSCMYDLNEPIPHLNPTLAINT